MNTSLLNVRIKFTRGMKNVEIALYNCSNHSIVYENCNKLLV